MAGLDSLGASVQALPVAKLPREVVKVTVPVGAIGGAGPRSATVAVQTESENRSGPRLHAMRVAVGRLPENDSETPSAYPSFEMPCTRVAVIVTRIARVPAGAVAVALRASSAVCPPRSACVTGPIWSAPPSASPEPFRKVAVTTMLSSWPA